MREDSLQLPGQNPAVQQKAQSLRVTATCIHIYGFKQIIARAFKIGGDNAIWKSQPSQRHYRGMIRATCLGLCYSQANDALRCTWTSTPNIEFDSSLGRMHINPTAFCTTIRLWTKSILYPKLDSTK